MLPALQVVPLLVVPGPPELLVILLIAVILFGVPLALVLAGAWVWMARKEPDPERVRELESEVEQLREEIARLQDSERDAPGGGERDGGRGESGNQPPG